MWSSPMGVTTATAPSATFVASHRPPMPTSTTAASTGASAKQANASAVSTSKKESLGPPSATLRASARARKGAMSSYACTNVASSTGTPSTTTRSRTECR